MMKTYSPKPEHIERSWYVVDASGQVLGRLASEVATLLRGKHKPIFAPHMDTGDHVVVINADKVELSGNKAQDKFAYRHSGYPAGSPGSATPTSLRPGPSRPSRRPSGACSRRTVSVGSRSRSSTSLRARSIRTRRRCPSNWPSANARPGRGCLPRRLRLR